MPRVTGVVVLKILKPDPNGMVMLLTWRLADPRVFCYQIMQWHGG